MIIRLKEECLVELNNIKDAQFSEGLAGCKIVISYMDGKKNADTYISCENKAEGILLIDKLHTEIKNSKRLRSF